MTGDTQSPVFTAAAEAISGVKGLGEARGLGRFITSYARWTAEERQTLARLWQEHVSDKLTGGNGDPGGVIAYLNSASPPTGVPLRNDIVSVSVTL